MDVENVLLILPKRKLSPRMLSELWVEQLCLPVRRLTSGILICNQNAGIKVEDTSNCIIVRPENAARAACRFLPPLTTPATHLPFFLTHTTHMHVRGIM